MFDQLLLELKLFLEVSQSKFNNNFLEFVAKLLKEDMTSPKSEKWSQWSKSMLLIIPISHLYLLIVPSDSSTSATKYFVFSKWQLELYIGIIPPVIEEELCVHNSSNVERNVLVDVYPWLPATANEV